MSRERVSSCRHYQVTWTYPGIYRPGGRTQPCGEDRLLNPLPVREQAQTRPIDRRVDTLDSRQCTASNRVLVGYLGLHLPRQWRVETAVR